MDLSKIFSYVTPFILVAVGGVIMIVEGLLHMGRENNPLQFIFGIPIAGFAVGAHFLVRRFLQGNTLYVWLVEGIIVAILWYQFLYVW